MLTDINTFYLIYLGMMFLVAKLLVIRFILKKITVRKTRNILLVLAILFSPTIFILLWLFRLGLLLWLVTSLAACPIDIAILNWVRVIFEPAAALDDIEYDSSLTG